MKPVILVGDSHTAVYRMAASQLGRADIRGGMLVSAGSLFGQFFSIEDGKLRFLGKTAENFMLYAYKSGVKNLQDHPRSLVVSMGFASAPFYGSSDWANTYSIAPESRERRLIVSDAVLRQMVEDAQRYVLAFYDYAHAQDLLFASLCGPRPQLRHGVVTRLGPQKVLRLVEAFERPVREKLAELGCPLLELPETVDAQGLLREEYWGDNASHANTAYGKLMLEKLDRLRPADAESSESHEPLPDLPWLRERLERIRQARADQVAPNDTGESKPPR